MFALRDRDLFVRPSILSERMASEVAESFQASLDELKFNSKPQISMLTMLAEDNEQYASEIVQVIEEQIKKVLFYVCTYFCYDSSFHLSGQ